MDLWDRIRPSYCKLTSPLRLHDWVQPYLRFFFPCALSVATQLQHPLDLPPALLKNLFEREKQLVVLEGWLAGLIVATAIVIRIVWNLQAPVTLADNVYLRLILFIGILVIYQHLVRWLARPFAESIVAGALVYTLRVLDDDQALNTRRGKERAQRYLLVAATQTVPLARLLASSATARKAVLNELKPVAAYFRAQEIEIAILGPSEARSLREMLARMLPLYLSGQYRELRNIVPDVPVPPQSLWRRSMPRLLPRLLLYFGMSIVIWWIADIAKAPAANLLIILIAARASDEIAGTGLTRLVLDFLVALKGRLNPAEPPSSPAEPLIPTEKPPGVNMQLRMPQESVKILFLAANPRDTMPLRLDEEIRSIDQALRQSEFRDKFDLRQHWAVRITDLQGLLLRHNPEIVHFSGHGSQASEINLEDDFGKSHPASVRALSELFSVLKDNIQCVVLNACYSERQAQAIAQHIDCVVGMSRAISDESSIRFSAAFYQALGFGRDVKTAFDLGCSQLDLENLVEQDVPKLLTRTRDPKEIVFIRKE